MGLAHIPLLKKGFKKKTLKTTHLSIKKKKISNCNQRTKPNKVNRFFYQY